MGVNRSAFVGRVKPYGLAILFCALGAAVFVVGVLAGLLWVDYQPPHFGVEVARAALTLGSGLILGGGVKVALDHYQQAQDKSEQARQARRQLVEELRDVRWRTASARLMIKAHKSTEAYAEQMSVLIDCRVVLLKLKHTMELLRGTTDPTDPRAACLDGMADYLAALCDEYADHYADLDDGERYDRAVVAQHIAELAAAGADFDADEIPIKQTWELMRETCPRMTDLIDGGTDHTKTFQLPLHHLIGHLWSVRETKPNELFAPGVVGEFKATLKAALDAADDPPADDEADDDATAVVS